jgi:flagellar motor switch protein FliG
VRFLLSDGQRPPLSTLPEDAQVDLTREMAQLRLVDRGTLDAILSEFADELEAVGLALRPGDEAALEAVAGHISPQAVERLKAEAARRRASDPWGEVASLPLPDLARMLSAESVEVAAVALSKLPVARAAEVLGLLPGPQARRITTAVSRTGAIAPEAVLRVGRALAEEHCAQTEFAFPLPPASRLGEILTNTPDATRDGVLEGLEAEDPPFAAEVRKAIFTFAHLPLRLRTADVPRVLRGVDQKVLVTALAAAQAGRSEEQDAAAYLLKALPQRLADTLREEMAGLGRLKPQAAEAAKGQVVAHVRERAHAGEIELLDPDVPEDAA